VSSGAGEASGARDCGAAAGGASDFGGGGSVGRSQAAVANASESAMQSV
jgi:hypothetical protein